MVIFPNCKINIGLNIVRKRGDGYHDLETVFYPVPLHDALEVVVAGGQDQFTQSGLAISGPASSNLCVKALHLLRREFPDIPPVQLHLHKAIPMGAGLGGGSSDGAHTLLLLNRKFNLGLGTEKLVALALELGSDCPFFILNQPCYAWSRGEMMEPLALPLQHATLVLINPGIHVNTGWAFSQITPTPSQFPLTELPQLPLMDWKDKVVNDFQAAVAAHHPVITQLVAHCYAHGAFYAAMSGSGSTCYGLFAAGSPLPNFSAFPGAWVKAVPLP